MLHSLDMQTQASALEVAARDHVPRSPAFFSQIVVEHDGNPVVFVSDFLQLKRSSI